MGTKKWWCWWYSHWKQKDICGKGREWILLNPHYFSWAVVWDLTWVLGWETLLTYPALSGRMMSPSLNSLWLCLLRRSTQSLGVFKEPQRDGGTGASFQVMWLESEPIDHLGSQGRLCPWTVSLALVSACFLQSILKAKPHPISWLHMTCCWLQILIPQSLRARAGTSVWY